MKTKEEILKEERESNRTATVEILKLEVLVDIRDALCEVAYILKEINKTI